MVFALLVSVAAVPARAAAPSHALAAACSRAGVAIRVCDGLEKLVQTGATACRFATDHLDSCGVLDGTVISEEAVDAAEHSWLARALAAQRGLDDTHPLQDELWAHTHNSFDADAYPPSLYGLDRNQIYTITDQLRMGVRAVELDVHWAQSLRGDPAHGFKSLLVCHGDKEKLGAGIVHTGCGVNDRDFESYLREIKAWMDDHPDDVLMLYVENALDHDPYAHQLAGKQLLDVFGSRLYRTHSDCATLPYDISRAQIRATGARIIVTGNCDATGTAWGAAVHVRGPRWIESTLDFGNDFPAYPCAAERARDHYATNWIRHYADETGLSLAAGEGGDVTVTDARNEVRCGVNMVGFDNLVPFDPRFEQLVWSWAPDQPSGGDCAEQSSDGRFRATACTTAMRFVCFDGKDWSVTERRGAWTAGGGTCAAEGRGTFSVPWNGYENERLKSVQHGYAWLAYRSSGGRWAPFRSSGGHWAPFS